METRRLANFIAIADCGSLTRAAERLHVAQPALSEQLAALEAAFGKTLLLRSRRGVTVTPAGRALYRNAQTLLRQLKQLESDVKSAGDYVSGHVSVGLPVTCAEIISIPFFSAVRERFPNVLLRISENLSGMLGELMLNNRLDMAVLYGTYGSEGFVRRPLMVERMCLFSRPTLAQIGPAATTIAVDRLADVPLVLPSNSNGMRALVDAAFSRHGLKPRVVAEIDSLPTLRSAAEDGLAATILPRSATRPEACGVRVLEIVEPTIARTLVLCRPSATASEPVEAVESVLVETIERLVSTGRWQGVARV